LEALAMMIQEANDLITSTGRNDPCGKLMRMYWQPAALVDELQGPRPVRSVKLLGENLVLFRDEEGRYGLIDRHCAHRGADLAFGRLENGGLRCAFHGWLFDSVTMPLLEPRRRSWLASHLPAAHSWQATIAEVRARRLAEQHLGRRATTELLAAGNSSQAWLATLDDERWVIRIPIPNSGRSMSYRSEASIGSQLAAVGHPVSDWTTVEVDHELCCFGPRLAGGPISYGEDWTEQFAAELGSLLHDLHHLPASGFGPLEDTEGEPRGCSSTAAAGIVARWFHAPIWPFDDTQFSDHPLTTIAPELAERIRPFRADIVDAAAGPHGIVHSDLHRHHLLVEDGHLSGVLDFGDAFVGSTAWDFALLHWYYGEDNTRKVAAAYPSGVDEFDRGRLLAAAVGCYKLARSPDDRAVLARLRAVVDGLRG
jgi:aminoglycoside phosphotransferase (APT) family kinase protein